MTKCVRQNSFAHTTTCDVIVNPGAFNPRTTKQHYKLQVVVVVVVVECQINTINTENASIYMH